MHMRNLITVAAAAFLGLAMVPAHAATSGSTTTTTTSTTTWKRNFAPSISGTPSTTGTVGVVYSFQPKASDKNGDSLTFIISGKPGWATFSITTGLLTGTPATAGTSSNIVVSVTDGRSTKSLAPFSITVSAPAVVNNPPTISGTPTTSVNQDTAYSFQPTASDPDGKTLTFSVQNKPTWASFDTTTGRLYGTPTSAYVGTYPSITIAASDGTYTTALPSYSLTVNATNLPPKISGTPQTSVNQDTAYAFQPSASDPEGQKLTFSVQNKPAWAAFDSAKGLLSGTPTAADVGTYSSITIKVSDGTNTASLPAYTLTVSQTANGQITVSWAAPQLNTDGTPLTDLSGYKIYYGTSATSLSKVVSVGTNLTAYVIQNLSSGTWYVAMTALNSQGVESAQSTPASKTVL